MPAKKKRRNLSVAKLKPKKKTTPKKSSARVLPRRARQPAPPAILVSIPHEQIARRAYEIWEMKIRIANQSSLNWSEAEAQFRSGQ